MSLIISLFFSFCALAQVDTSLGGVGLTTEAVSGVESSVGRDGLIGEAVPFIVMEPSLDSLSDFPILLTPEKLHSVGVTYGGGIPSVFLSYAVLKTDYEFVFKTLGLPSLQFSPKLELLSGVHIDGVDFGLRSNIVMNVSGMYGIGFGFTGQYLPSGDVGLYGRIRALLLKHQFTEQGLITYYCGLESDHQEFNLDIAKISEVADDLFKIYKKVVLGVYYNHNVYTPISFGLEGDASGSISGAFYFKI